MINKVTKAHLENDRYILRSIEEFDLTPRYLEWLNDPEINKFLDFKITYTIDDLYRYFYELDDNKKLLFALIDKKSKTHIGNLTLNPIDRINNKSGLGGIIGDKNFWGGSGAFVAGMELLLGYAFNELGYHKVHSGVVIENIPCIIASKKVGFVQEGLLKEHFRSCDGKYLDVLLFGKINPGKDSYEQKN